ncbi:hypothetical protein ACJJTC_015792, partial [Scirpophaga incertulas]
MASRVVCASCRTVIKDGKILNCCLCKKTFDIKCANVPKDHLITHKQTWKCSTCKSVEPKADNTNTPVRDDRTVHNVTRVSERLPGETRTQHLALLFALKAD